MLSIFETAIATAPQKPAPRKRSQLSPAEKLYRDLQTHRAREEAVLAETERARELAATPLTRFVLDLLEDGQTKQLNLVDRMTASLRDALYWTYSPDALPDASSDDERAAAVEALQRIIRAERDRIRGAKRLAKSYAGINGGLERALLQASIAASEANVKLLRLLVERLERGEASDVRPNTVWDSALRQRKLAQRDRKAA